MLLLRALAELSLEHLAHVLLVSHQVGLVLADEGVVAIVLMAAGREHHQLAAQRRHLDGRALLRSQAIQRRLRLSLLGGQDRNDGEAGHGTAHGGSPRSVRDIRQGGPRRQYARNGAQALSSRPYRYVIRGRHRHPKTLGPPGPCAITVPE